MIDKELIISYLKSGLSILPVNGDNGKTAKAPAITSWKQYQTSKMPFEKIDLEFSRANAIGIIGGYISGNLEIIDFDNHDGLSKERFKKFLFFVGDLIRKYNIPYETTPSGGYHIFYRSEKIKGNEKLAQKINNGKKDTIIETRGEGGYVVSSPSKGYELVYGDLLHIPVITKEQRINILNMCRSFNEIADSVVDSESKYSVIERRPGDEYNVDIRGTEEAKALLIKQGWTNPINNYWVRPGKDKSDGISATFNVVKKDDGTPLFHVFSSNADPFQDNKNYTPFAIFTMLAHNGDFSHAAKELVDEGYGDQCQKVHEKKELPREIKNKLVATAEKEPKIKETKKKKSDITEAKEYLNKAWRFRLNVINNTIEAKRVGYDEWNLVNENDVWIDINEYGIKMRKDNVKSILGSSYVPQYNAFRNYFENLHEWDGVDYFFDLVKHMTIDDPEFFRTMLEKHFVRAIKCALEDEYYNRMVFVLQSKKQEFGKSRFIHNLNPFGNNYYSEQPLSENKDCQIALSQTFIYNLEELDDLKSNRVSSIKANLSKATILERRPYATQSSVMPRRCSFFASTNYTEFLVDDVNTRWLIFKVDDIDKELWATINIDDLWAQAWTLYNNPNYEYELTIEEKVKREERNKIFREVPPETGLIIKYFEKSEDSTMSLTELTQLLTINAGYGFRICSSSSLSQQLDSLGFEYVEEKFYDMPIKMYKIKLKMIRR